MPKGRGKAQKANFTFIYKTDNEKRTYTLNVKESGSVSMTVIISPMKDGQEVCSVVLDSEYWDSFNEQMAELGNNLRDSGIEVRQNEPGRDGEDAENYPPVIERTGCLCHS